MVTFSIVTGSHRKESQSHRVGKVVEQVIKKEQPKNKATVINLGGNPVPLFDEGIWSGDAQWKEVWTPIAKTLQASDALVVCVPEWSGMAPPAIKNFFLLSSNRELAHKPVLLIGVSSGTGGAYPVAELRMSSYKNNHLCYIPEQVIVRHVEQNLLDLEKPASQEDDIIIKRLHYCIRLLEQYAVALKNVRESGVIDHKTFGNGM